MDRTLAIDGVRVSDDSDCYVIAEIGHNHQGSIEQCKELFNAAKECGANAVKLQKRHNQTLFTREMLGMPYINRHSFGATYGEHRKALEFGADEYRELQKHANELGITFFATVFDSRSAEFLTKLDVPAFKIASGDLVNIPLLQHVASFGKPMLVSTGGGTLEDVQRAYDAIMPINRQLCLMQCTAGYPPAFEELNLKAIQSFRDRFPDIVIGLSSHDSGIAMALVGYVLGARIIEKHFTLNRAMKGSDQAFSLERPGLRRLVRDLRRARLAMGDGVKQRYASEEQPLYKMSKKLVFARDLPAGHVLAPDDIAIKSPNDGLPPYEIDKVIGKMTRRSVCEDENVALEDLTRV
jgi:N-acetylneuraminate synthase/sialic acid synthase